MGVCDVEHVAAAANEAAAGHREHGCADVRVAAHGLIDHHVVDVFRRARTLGVAHVAGDIAVFERDGVLTLDDKGFGVVRCQVRILHGDVRRGVDRGGVVAVRGVRAAAHVDRAAAGGLDAAGVIRRGGDGGIGDIHGRAAAVTEHAVAILRRGRDGCILDGHRRAVHREKRCVHAVKFAVLGVRGHARALVDGDAVERDGRAVHAQGVFVIAGRGVASAAVGAVLADGRGGGALRHLAAAAKALAAAHGLDRGARRGVVAADLNGQDIALGEVAELDALVIFCNFRIREVERHTLLARGKAAAALRFAVRLVGRRLAGIGTARHVMGRHTARTQLAELHRHGSAVNIGDLAGDGLTGVICRALAAARGERQRQRRRTEKRTNLFAFHQK